MQQIKAKETLNTKFLPFPSLCVANAKPGYELTMRAATP